MSPSIKKIKSKNKKTAKKREKDVFEEELKVVHKVDQECFDNISEASREITIFEEDLDEDYDQIPGQFGLVVIFNFRKRTGKESPKDDPDTLLLRDCFQNLGFEVRSEGNNLKKKHFVKKLKSIASEDFCAKSSLIIVFMTHGGLEGNLYTPDGDYITSWEICSFFDDTKCPSLRGKPKIFILQACKHLNKTQYFTEEAEKIREPNISNTYKLPTNKDMLLSYSTVEGNITLRTKDGSWFIEELCRNIEKYAQTEELCNILIRTSRSILRRSKEANKYFIFKQMPCFLSTLTRKFYLSSDRDVTSVSVDTMKYYVTENKNLKQTMENLEKQVYETDRIIEEVRERKNFGDPQIEVNEASSFSLVKNPSQLSTISILDNKLLMLLIMVTLGIFVTIFMVCFSKIGEYMEEEEVFAPETLSDKLQFYTDLVFNFMKKI